MNALRKRLPQLILPFLAMLVLVYTAYQLLNGEKGIYTWKMLGEQVAGLQAETAALQADVARLKRHVARLKPPVDKDYVDELMRRTLAVGKEGEKVVLTVPSSYGGRTASPTMP